MTYEDRTDSSTPEAFTSRLPSMPQYTGRYTRVFLNRVFGRDRYTVRTIKLGTLNTTQGMQAAMDALDDPRLSLAFMSDEKLTLLWLHDYPGWMAFCQPKGIAISPSPKIAKRLTVMTRTGYLHGIYSVPTFRMAEVEPGEFSDYNVEDVGQEAVTRFLDGGNVLSRELIESMMTFATEEVEHIFMTTGQGNPHDRAIYNTRIDETQSLTAVRITTPEGQIKGDALISTREKMGGYDVLYCAENIKPELKTSQFIFALAEPHHPAKRHVFSPDRATPPPVWSDDQSMSWLGEWLYDPEELKECLRDFADSVELDLSNSRYPSFFTVVGKLEDDYSTVQQFQEQALRWELEGPGRTHRKKGDDPRKGTSLNQSVFLQERVAQGAVNMMAKKRRWPIPCAVYVHVATDSWLHMAGYDSSDGHPWPFEEPCTPRGYIWLHEPSGRMIYNDMDFAEAYDRHGGWDLDDGIKAMYRTDANGKKVIVVVRSPNSWGEYDIKNYVEGTFFPVWNTAEGEKISFPQLPASGQPEFIEDLDITYKYPLGLSPSEVNGDSAEESVWSGANYTREQVRCAVKTGAKFAGVFGSRANADIVYFHTMKTYRREQLSSIEAIVDACTQEQSDKALELIKEDTEDIINKIKESDQVADRVLWQQRLKVLTAGVSYDALDWTDLTVAHNDMCALYRHRLTELAQRAVENVDPDILRLGERLEGLGGKMVEWYYQLVKFTPRSEDMSTTEFYHKINDRMVDHMMQAMSREKIYDLILGMARYVYTVPRADVYKDTPLFQVSKPGLESVFELYLEAINFYGIGDEEWGTSITCDLCSETQWFADRVAYQDALWGRHCS